MSNFRWHPFPDVILRKTGFAFDLLETLYCPNSVAAIKDLLENEREQELLREQFQQIVLRKEELSGLSSEQMHLLEETIWAKDRQQFPPDLLSLELPTIIAHLFTRWKTLVLHKQSLYTQASTIFHEELHLARQKLRQIVSDNRFQEAIFLNSPTMYRDGLLPYLNNKDAAQRSNSKSRQREQTLMLYLQRFCSKNDTASFFGPMNYGQFRPEIDDNIHYRVVDGNYPPQRRVLMSYWAAEMLMQTMNHDPYLLAERKPIRSALITFKEESIFLPSLDRDIALDILSLTILRLADARTSLRTMSRMLEIPLDTLITRAQRLEAYQLLTLCLPLARYTVDPLGAVEESIHEFAPSEAKTRWEGITARFRSGLKALETAQLQERLQLLPFLEQLFTEVVGVDAQRGKGQLFSDRFIFYEETSGDVVDFTIGGNLYQDIVTRLQAHLDILASCALADYHEGQRQGKQQLEAILPLTGNASYLLNLYLQARLSKDITLKENPSSKTLWQQAWHTLLKTHQGQQVSLRGEDISAAILEPLEEQRLLAGPDIMIAAQDADAIRRGDYKIILSEVHPLLLPTHKDLSLFYPNLSQALGKARILLDHLIYPQQELVFASRRVSKADIWPIGRPTIYPQWVRKDIDTPPLPIADIKVDVSTEQTPVFRVAGCDAACTFALPLIIDEPIEPFLMCFTRPQIWARSVIKAPHTPRIEIDNIVFQRERWDLGSDDLPTLSAPIDSFDAFLSLWRWKQIWNMPNQLFFSPKTDKMTKPILIDFFSPLSCFSAFKVMGRSRGGTFTEMLPNPEQLWLQHNGQRYTSEVRFTSFRMPETFNLEEATPLFASHHSMLEQEEIISQQLKAGIALYVEKGASFHEETLEGLAQHLRFVQEEVRSLTTEE